MINLLWELKLYHDMLHLPVLYVLPDLEPFLLNAGLTLLALPLALGIGALQWIGLLGLIGIDSSTSGLTA